ncbi:MAG: PilZ domain-containing protein [bacterium]|nr:PilZ domain-containing protein [bacterium]
MFWRKDTQKNRREYIRLEKAFRVKYGIIKLDKEIPVQYDLLDSVELKYSGHTKDICEGGLCMENEDLKELLKTSIKEETELKLIISIHGEKKEDINTVGKVAWIDFKRDVCGIEFISILYEDRLKIRNYVRDEYFENYKR